VPTFTCGFVRSNFAFAMEPSKRINAYHKIVTSLRDAFVLRF